MHRSFLSTRYAQKGQTVLQVAIIHGHDEVMKLISRTLQLPMEELDVSIFSPPDFLYVCLNLVNRCFRWCHGRFCCRVVLIGCFCAI